jgi:SAM-dependent methyltransferase
MRKKSFDGTALRRAVAQKYGQVAVRPAGDHPFPVGRAFAETVGYSSQVLDSLPSAAVESFTGISNPLAYADLRPGEAVLDLGCGAGTDTLLAARQVGPTGWVIGVDLAEEMVAKARGNVAALNLSHAEIRLAAAEDLPLDDQTMDAVIVNGIFNLCPSKEAVATEIWRVLKPGGRLLVSEIVLQMPDEEAAAFQPASLANTSSPEAALAKWFS